MLWTAERLAAALGVDISAVRLRFVACPMIEIASRELRRAITDGMSIRYMVPRAVEEYIRERKLYTASA
jgi:nicotinate-nucleotide adenylyltransferase